jgi:Fe-S-cluster containining protein
VNRAGFRDLHTVFARIVMENRDSARLPERLVDRAFELFEANISPLTRHLPALACEKGCPSCCVLRVTAAAPEIILLADYVRRVEATPQGAAIGLKRRIELADRATRGLGEAERMALRKPCPFIVRGVCLIHPVRPLACRGHASFDRKACVRAAAGRDVEVPLSEPHRALRALVQTALQSALRAAGLAWGLYELNHGLMLMLGQDQRGGGWRVKQDGLAAAALDFDWTAAAAQLDAELAM